MPWKAAARLMQKPRSHDTSRTAWAKLMPRVGEGVSARVPELRRCHPADRVDHGGGADRPEVLTLQIKGSRSAGRPLWKGHWPDYPFLGLAAGYKPVASSYLAQIWWLSPFPSFPCHLFLSQLSANVKIWFFPLHSVRKKRYYF
jgi:hypothetical protein